MSSRDEQWWDLQAAEYVLGSLSDEDKVVFKQLLRSDPDVQRRVHEWEARLDPLHQSTRAVEPSAQVFDKITARIALANTESKAVNNNVVPLKEWKKRVQFWQTATVATFATAAAIIGFLVFSPMQLLPRDVVPSISDTQFSTVSILENESGQPIWAINFRQLEADSESSNSFDQGVGELVISVVGEIPLESDQSHQLWMVLADGSGVQSVGLMPNTRGESKILRLPLELSAAESFAVSLEAFGGVPGPEHGPVVAINPIVIPAESI